MRILLLYNTMDVPETQLIKQAVGEGISMDVLCNPAGDNQRLLDGSEISVRPLVCRSRIDFKAIRTIRNILQSQQYDIIHAFTSRMLSASILASVGLKHQPKIVAYRGAMCNVSKLDPTSWLTYRNPKVDSINCVSDAVRKYLEECGICQSKLIRIYKGHDVAWYEEDVIAQRSDLNIPDNAFVVTCVANMRPNKGVDVLIEAAGLLAEYKDFHYLLVGDIQDQRIAAIAQACPAVERLHFTGLRSDVTQLLRASDLFVMPTRYTEGFPKAVIEAMCQIVPPIVTRIGGMVELVRADRDGKVVDACCPQAIAEAILELYQHPEKRSAFGASARSRIEEDFNIANTVLQTRQWYFDIANQARD